MPKDALGHWGAWSLERGGEMASLGCRLAHPRGAKIETYDKEM